MPIPSPLTPIKGAGTTLWVYTGNDDPYADPLSDINWSRLAQVKDLTPGELTAESYDDTYLDNSDADWVSTAQGQKSAGESSFTLAWKPGETGQKNLMDWFHSGDIGTYKIRYPNGVVDVYSGWVSSLGKAIPVKETITRSVKITNKGRPVLAEDNTIIIPVTGVTVAPDIVEVVVGETVSVAVTVLPANASDKSFLSASENPLISTVSALDGTVSISGIVTGETNVVILTNNGKTATIIPVVVS